MQQTTDKVSVNVLTMEEQPEEKSLFFSEEERELLGLTKKKSSKTGRHHPKFGGPGVKREINEYMVGPRTLSERDVLETFHAVKVIAQYMTPQEIAKQMGIHRRSINYYLREERRMSNRTSEVIMEIYNNIMRSKLSTG